MHTHTYIYKHTYIHIFIYVYIYMCVYIYIYIYIYICICIFRQHFFVNANFIKHNRHFISTYFLLDPFEFPIKVILEFERIQKKICRHKMSIMFNEICTYIYIYIYTYAHTHTQTQIYIYVIIIFYSHQVQAISYKFARDVFWIS